MKRKDTTESGLPEETESRLRREVLKLTHNLDEQKKKRDRRDRIFYGCFLGFIVLLTILGIATGNWLGVLFNLSTLMWILVLWTKDKYINLMRHIVDMQFGLRDLEIKELELAMKGKK